MVSLGSSEESLFWAWPTSAANMRVMVLVES